MNSDEALKDILSHAKKSSMPEKVMPMLATLVDEPFDDPEWLYEVKWDGYRAVSYINKGKVDILSRNNKSFNDKYYPLRQLLAEWKIDAVIDGEIIVLNEKGQSNFGKLQNWRSEADGELTYYVFDILWYDGLDLMNLPLTDRKKILNDVLPKNDDRIRLSQVVDSNGNDFFEAAKQIGLEGIIAKKKDSLYAPDTRSKVWLKIKAHKRQEVVIGGFTKSEGSAKKFSSLLLGVYEGNKLYYVGKVGTGFADKLQTEMRAQFKPLIVDKAPFVGVPDVNS